ncbi:unnamed protein product [Discula destructiva]
MSNQTPNVAMMALLRERIQKDHKSSVYTDVISNVQDFVEQRHQYMARSRPPASYTDDFPNNDADLRKLAKGLTDALTNFEEAQEAGQKSVARLLLLSPYEVSLKSWELMFTIRDVQLGHIGMTSWGVDWKHEEFPCYMDRLSDVCSKLRLSKSLASSLFDEGFAVRLALNPNAEFRKKMANFANNTKRSEALVELKKSRKKLEDNADLLSNEGRPAKRVRTKDTQPINKTASPTDGAQRLAGSSSSFPRDLETNTPDSLYGTPSPFASLGISNLDHPSPRNLNESMSPVFNMSTYSAYNDRDSYIPMGSANLGDLGLFKSRETYLTMDMPPSYHTPASHVSDASNTASRHLAPNYFEQKQTNPHSASTSTPGSSKARDIIDLKDQVRDDGSGMQFADKPRNYSDRHMVPSDVENRLDQSFFEAGGLQDQGCFGMNVNQGANRAGTLALSDFDELMNAFEFDNADDVEFLRPWPGPQ